MPGNAEYGLLGPLTVRRAGAEIQVVPGKQQVVLAALLLRGGQLTGIDELTDALWGEQPPPSAQVSVRNYVARLRQALGPGGDALIVTEPGGYRIAIGPGELDVDRLAEALAAGQARARAGDWDQAARILREGLALWRGEPLTGLGSEVLAARHGPRLSELRWQAAESLAEAELRLGRHREVIAGLQQATAEQPLRERLHALLMLALYRDGQQAAALAAYQDARNVLSAELGTEPGPPLQRLHQQILAADPALAASGPAGPPSGPEARYALPPDVAAFIGRDDELGAITAAVISAAAASGVVAIQSIGGMPGVGKTALAVHAAHRLAGEFPDRRLLIDLYGHTPGQDPVAPADGLAGLLLATGLDPRALPDGLEARTALWRHRMSRQRALLILDNAASSAQVAPLLPGGAGCLVLVTSRRHLGDLPGAVPVLLEALPPGQAREMFLRLAPRAAGSADSALAELTELAGFLPLAISLLARLYDRHPSWTLADLAAETRASLLTLAAGQDSVAAAFETSYRHLPDGRRRFFRALGLHPGTTADAYAAAALAGIPVAEAAAHLDALHGEGLLTETGYRRYGMHDLIRRYARNLAAAGPAASSDLALGRLLDYYASAGARAESRLARQTRPGRPPVASADLAVPDLNDDAHALAWARAERASLLACLDHASAAGHDARVVALTAGLAGLLLRDGPWEDAITRHAAAAGAAERLSDRLGQASALSDLGAVRLRGGDYPAATRVLEQALEIFRGLGNRLGQANALRDLGTIQWLTGDYPAAAELLEQALGICRDIGDRLGQANALRDLGAVRWLTGDFPAASEVLEQALGICRVIGDRLGQANALRDLGAVRWLTGDYPGATQALEHALGICRDLGDRRGQASALGYLAEVRRLTGDYPAAAQAQEQALHIFRDVGDRRGQASALGYLGAALCLAGDYPAAAQALEQALDISRDLGDRLGQANALLYLGTVRRLTGDYPAAAQLLERSLDRYRELGDRVSEAEALNERGTLHRVSDELAQAQECHQRALELARAVASSRDEAQALAGLGRCARAAGRAGEAAPLLRQALEIFRQLGAAEAPALAAELEELEEPEEPDAPAGS